MLELTMVTSETFKICHNTKERRINSEISKLRNERNKLYEDLELTDEELKAAEMPINTRIYELIDELFK